ncbi:hypothetical protein E2C01_033489 [Portunus trituberculatus]|uniref:Uncharacterized protein n=1 Tax=Portunus trituberculatus TaxID=210409 RepID=A0A5B7F3K2_PORTR|nr:hypothetical protein [Portunus trituberculatus]
MGMQKGSEIWKNYTPWHKKKHSENTSHPIRLRKNDFRKDYKRIPMVWKNLRKEYRPNPTTTATYSLSGVPHLPTNER